MEKPACPLGAEGRRSLWGVGLQTKEDTLTLDHRSPGRGRQLESLTFHLPKHRTPRILNSWTTLFFLFSFFSSLNPSLSTASSVVLENFVRAGPGVCVCQLYGFVCELRDVCVGAAAAICCPGRVWKCLGSSMLGMEKWDWHDQRLCS